MQYYFVVGLLSALILDLCSMSLVCVYVCEQAGDLYEKIRNNQRALECYCKGGAFRKGKTQHGLGLSGHWGAL